MAIQQFALRAGKKSKMLNVDSQRGGGLVGWPEEATTLLSAELNIGLAN